MIFDLFKHTFLIWTDACIFLNSQGKWEVPLPKVKGMSEAEVFKVVKSGKTKRKHFITQFNLISGFFFSWFIFFVGLEINNVLC